MEHNKYSKLKIPKCLVCVEEMELTNIHNPYFENTQHNFFICKKDNINCYQIVENGKIIYQEYREGE